MIKAKPFERLSVTFAATVLAGLLFYFAGRYLGDSPNRWWSVLPPLVAVAFAMGTQRLLLSLFIGVLLGGFLASDGLSNGIRQNIATFGSVVSDSTNLWILVFVASVMPLVTVTLCIGGVQQLLQKMSQRSAGRKSSQVLTVLLGLVLFIDDYANTILVGSTMRPMTDRFAVSREKLAFLVDATSAPVAGLAVLSTWVGYEVGLFEDVMPGLGVDQKGYTIFLDIFVYRFYCWLMLGFVIINVVTGREFGSMLRAENRASQTGKLVGDDARIAGIHNHESDLETQGESFTAGRVVISFVPFVVLFSVFLLGLWIDGGGQGRSPLQFETWRSVLGEANSIIVLAIASLAGLLAAMTSAFCANVRADRLIRSLHAGLRAALLPVIVLILAWSLKQMCDALGTDAFLVNTFADVSSPIWLPAVTFILAGLTAFATGTSWGTMAILIPTIAPVAVQLDGGYGLTTMLALAAILDGAIFGDHCSPISDTTIMSSTSSQCDHLHHVQTQIPYALLVAAVAIGMGYIAVAMGLAAGVAMVGGLLVLITWIVCVGRKVSRRVEG